jgi:tetratricopeptide (TPR) repeat protein
MEFDRFGLPKGQDFDERPPRTSPRITPGRIATLLIVLGIAGAGAALVEFGPEWLEGRDKDRRAQMAGAWQAQANHVMGLHRIGKDDEALAECDKLIRMAPRMLGPYGLRSSIYAKLGRYREAIDDCNFVLRHVPDDATSLNNRAYFRAMARQDIPAALRDIERSLKLAGEIPAYLDTRAYLHYLNGDFKAALADYDRILENPDFGAKDAPVAAAADRDADDSFAEIYFHRGLVYKQLGKQKEKEADYARARALGHVIQEEPPPLPKGPIADA